MTEHEKLLKGKTYNPRDPELLELYHRAKDLLRVWHKVETREPDRKFELLESLFGKVGKGVWVEAPFYCDYGKHISVGANTFINTNCVFLDCHKITIGKNGLIGPNVQIYTVTHPIKASERVVEDPKVNEAPYKTSAKAVTIGDNVWIGGNAVILPGVNIGNNVTIAAGSIVTKNVPDDVLVMGSPATTVKKL